MSTFMGQARARMPRIAETALEQARLTVVPRRRPITRRVPFVTLVITLLVTGVAGLLLFNTSMQQASFAAAALETRAADASARQQALQRELELLRNPQRVAERAQTLGMVPAPSPAFLRLADGAVLGSPVVASAEDRLRITEREVVKPRALSPEPVVVRVPARVRPAERADAAAGTARRGVRGAAAAGGRNAAGNDVGRGGRRQPAGGNR
ncbi:MAG: hypothetical protein Q8Q02_10230 [Nocardioides sp.]|nr:hypothetical protein [Nocardioides sp.]